MLAELEKSTIPLVPSCRLMQRLADPRVFDILSDLAAAVGREGGEIEVICGYRSTWSNDFLRERSSGVAKKSLHMQAHAIDIRISGVDTLTLRNAALALGRGGVGYYPRSGFVHVDTGRRSSPRSVATLNLSCCSWTARAITYTCW